MRKGSLVPKKKLFLHMLKSRACSGIARQKKLLILHLQKCDILTKWEISIMQIVPLHCETPFLENIKTLSRKGIEGRVSKNAIYEIFVHLS